MIIIGAVNSNNRTGKICYTNGEICKYLLPEQFKEYENAGWHKGTLRRPLSKESRNNISKGTRIAMQSEHIKNKLSVAAKQNSNKERFMKVRRKDWHTMTKHEKYISDFMFNLGFEYQKRIDIERPNKYYMPDFVNDKLKIIIELDGKSHNNITEKEIIRTELLENLGYEIHRFKNKEVYEENYKSIIYSIIAKRKLVMKNE